MLCSQKFFGGNFSETWFRNLTLRYMYILSRIVRIKSFILKLFFLYENWNNFAFITVLANAFVFGNELKEINTEIGFYILKFLCLLIKLYYSFIQILTIIILSLEQFFLFLYSYERNISTAEHLWLTNKFWIFHSG